MIRIINNELYLNDGTFYNLSNTSKERVLQGLNSQLQEGSLTKAEYNQCLELISMSKKEELKNLEEVCKPVGTAQEVPVQEQSKEIVIDISDQNFSSESAEYVECPY